MHWKRVGSNHYGYKVGGFNNKKQAKSFFYNLFDLFVEGLKDYYVSMPDYDKTHGFMYSEQQTKSFLAPAIAKLSKNSYLQECPIERRPNRRFKVNGRAGHVDYWVNQKHKGCSYVIEVKQNWFRYWKDKEGNNKFTIYKSAFNKMNNAIHQIKTIRSKGQLNYCGNMFAISLLIAPVYNFREKVNVNDPIIESLKQEIKKLKANVYSIWKIENRYCNKNKYRVNGKKYEEYYPLVAFIGRIKKISK